MKRRKNKLSTNRLVILGVPLALILAVGGVFAYRHFTAEPAAPTNVTGIDLSPATEEEKKDSERRKEEVVNEEGNLPEGPGGSISVTPIIVDASQYGDQIEVRAYIPGIYEDGGTCTVTISKGALKVTKQSAATKDATTTRCTNVNINRSEFQEAGQWAVTVTYSSPAAQGSSQPKPIEVQ